MWLAALPNKCYVRVRRVCFFFEVLHECTHIMDGLWEAHPPEHENNMSDVHSIQYTSIMLLTFISPCHADGLRNTKNCATAVPLSHQPFLLQFSLSIRCSYSQTYPLFGPHFSLLFFASSFALRTSQSSLEMRKRSFWQCGRPSRLAFSSTCVHGRLGAEEVASQVLDTDEVQANLFLGGRCSSWCTLGYTPCT